MLSNRAARRLLGMPYKLSNSKRRVTISLLNLEASTDKQQIPEHLSHSSFISTKRDTASGKMTYHSGNAFYPEHVNKNQ
ncbi:stationary-phase-induced ribosome-associated protein [Xenorhabdus bharatensis]|uniref:stationary-phase-induced ribosome-associated protein n=1 Tax=Xenorhabdus bharatensis TaxID=3136256 RepID=UPI0030F4A417